MKSFVHIPTWDRTIIWDQPLIHIVPHIYVYIKAGEKNEGITSPQISFSTHAEWKLISGNSCCFIVSMHQLDEIFDRIIQERHKSEVSMDRLGSRTYIN